MNRLSTRTLTALFVTGMGLITAALLLAVLVNTGATC